ncbi:uncharacterized protein LOC143447471 [Clavelina lepadiformis]|uniref:uncharacterized protein LOC143447471 n=1 Tax=Clavelina lepadiformis TaxID=159417 RepID=UPI00404288F1
MPIQRSLCGFQKDSRRHRRQENPPHSFARSSLIFILFDVFRFLLRSVKIQTWLLSTSAMGNDLTYVLNQSPDEIEACVTFDQREITSVKANVGVEGLGLGGQTTFESHNVQPGFCRIKSGGFLSFDNSGKEKKTVYVSIKSASKTIADNLPVREGYGVKVDADGYVALAKLAEIKKMRSKSIGNVSTGPDRSEDLPVDVGQMLKKLIFKPIGDNLGDASENEKVPDESEDPDQSDQDE